MPAKWDPDTFHLGINMAGSVSAGAYTAGVLDFLMEALEEWYAARASSSASVPMHRISIDVFSGASAGGMCAAIAAVMVQGNFEHIRNPFDPSVKDTTNKFYESWVNKVDIEYLLQDRDLGDGKPVISLLDSTIIDDIANYALVAGIPARREYISDSLTLFLSLTNVRGTPFSLSGSGEGSAEEQIAYYADKLQFETVDANGTPESASAKPLPLGSNAGAWPLLKEAAKATGAFPLFLAPRQLKRIAADYTHSPWEPVSNLTPEPVPPLWPLHAADEIVTLNVDGGVTNNDPFQLAHDYLAIHNPLACVNLQTKALENPRPSNQANCAVLTVAPFPSKAQFDQDFDFARNSSIFGMLPNLFTALISQSRFLGESLSSVTSGKSSSRFVLAPSDPNNPGEKALQCALLGAFGGFFWRGFRAHDFQLGRRNCQKFLMDYFRLAIDNPIIAAGLQGFDPAVRGAVLEKFDPKQTKSLPIIPLCGTAVNEVPYPAPVKIPPDRVAHIVNWVVDRMHAVTKPLLASVIENDFDCWAARSAVDTLISTWGKCKLKEVLQKELSGLVLD